MASKTGINVYPDSTIVTCLTTFSRALTVVFSSICHSLRLPVRATAHRKKTRLFGLFEKFCVISYTTQWLIYISCVLSYVDYHANV